MFRRNRVGRRNAVEAPEGPEAPPLVKVGHGQSTRYARGAGPRQASKLMAKTLPLVAGHNECPSRVRLGHFAMWLEKVGQLALTDGNDSRL